jgi:dTMP kinase
MSGVFITLEGGEGAGKSTQIRRLGAALAEQGHVTVETREPGGSPGAEAIRAVLLDPARGEFDATTQALLFAAARRDHLRARVRPALADGAVVICDRFIDSTRAYQGAGGALSPAVVRRLEALAIGRTRPHLTLILDLDPAIGMRRARLRQGATAASDPFEQRAMEFHARVRGGVSGHCRGGAGAVRGD